jgi:hypothetical protein
MQALSNHAATGIVSQLVDVADLPLSKVRSLDDSIVETSIRYAVWQARSVQVCDQHLDNVWTA